LSSLAVELEAEYALATEDLYPVRKPKQGGSTMAVNQAEKALEKPPTMHQFTAIFAEELNLGSDPEEDYQYTKKDVEEILDTLADLITRITKKHGKVVVRNLFRANLVARKARMGRNPQTGESIKIKASKKLRMTPDKKMRDALGSK
jgi:DNA-binding protein HU-beta